MRKSSIDQQRLHRPADAGAAQLGVERERQRHHRIGGGVDIGVTDAVEMREHRHAGIGLHPRDKALAAARHDHINEACRSQQRAHRRTVLRRDQLHRFGRHAAGHQPFDQGGVDRAVGMHRLAPPAQQRRIARAHAQRGGIGSDVGAALIDDPDGADRHADAGKGKPVGPRAPVDHLSDRIGQIGHRRHGIGDSRKPRLVERQPVEHRLAEPAGRARGKVFGIGCEDRWSGLAQRVGRKLQRGCAGCARHRGKRALGTPRRLGERCHQRGGIAGFGRDLLGRSLGHAGGLSSRAAACQARRPCAQHESGTRAAARRDFRNGNDRHDPNHARAHRSARFPFDSTLAAFWRFDPRGLPC